MVDFILALARLISYIVGYKTLNPKKTNFFGILIFDENSETPLFLVDIIWRNLNVLKKKHLEKIRLVFISQIRKI